MHRIQRPKHVISAAVLLILITTLIIIMVTLSSTDTITLGSRASGAAPDYCENMWANNNQSSTYGALSESRDIRLNARANNDITMISFSFENFWTKQPIQFSPGQNYIQTVPLSQPGREGSITLSYEDIDKIDHNNKSKPAVILVYATFTDSTNKRSSRSSVCSFQINVRPSYCSSASVQPTTLTRSDDLTISSSANTTIAKFAYAFYNTDNLHPAPPADNPKGIQFEKNEIYVRWEEPSSDIATDKTRISFSDLDKADTLWNNKKPENVQVNVYFQDTWGRFSAADSSCVVRFSVDRSAVRPTLPQATTIPTVPKPTDSVLPTVPRATAVPTRPDPGYGEVPPSNTPSPTPRPKETTIRYLSDCSPRIRNWIPLSNKTIESSWIQTRGLTYDQPTRKFGSVQFPSSAPLISQCAHKKVEINGTVRISHNNTTKFIGTAVCKEDTACPTPTPRIVPANLKLRLRTNMLLDSNARYAEHSLAEDFKLKLIQENDSRTYTLPVDIRSNYYYGDVDVMTTGAVYSIEVSHQNAPALAFDNVRLARNTSLNCRGTGVADCGEMNKWNEDEYVLLFGDANNDGDITTKDLNTILEYYTQEVSDNSGALYNADINKDGIIDGKDMAIVVSALNARNQ